LGRSAGFPERGEGLRNEERGPTADRRDTVAGAMNFLANTDALVIDLRENGGGQPDMVQLFCSYLFDAQPVHLNDLYFRPMDQTRQFWTLPWLPGKRYLDKDVYVLTSHFTFSGAEECTYNLQTQKRARIVGETTGGGANPGGPVELTKNLTAFVPTGRAINPITGSNWEGTGVEPDVQVPAKMALETAQSLALRKLIDGCQDGDRRQALSEALHRVELDLASLEAAKTEIEPAAAGRNR
jgi:C-terminal processing protease CtpA/Prc